MKFMAVLELLRRLWDSWLLWKALKKEERIQDAYDKNADDPLAWFDAEFGGLPDPTDSPPKSTSSPTSKTNSSSE